MSLAVNTHGKSMQVEVTQASGKDRPQAYNDLLSCIRNLVNSKTDTVLTFEEIKALN